MSLWQTGTTRTFGGGVSERKRLINVICACDQCFCEGRTVLYPSDQCVALPCKVHFMCETCMRPFIEAAIRANPTQDLWCPACVRSNRQETTKFDRTFILQFMDEDEFDDLFVRKFHNQFNKLCQSKYDTCPLQGRTEREMRLHCFACKQYYFCKDCLGRYVAEQAVQGYEAVLRSAENKLRNAGTGNTVDNGIFLVGCPDNNHENCKDPTLRDEITDIINRSSTIPHDLKAGALEVLKLLNRYFTGYLVNFVKCVHCNQLLEQEDENDTQCSNCKKCVSCTLGNHAGIPCDSFLAMNREFPLLHEINVPSDSDRSQDALFFRKVTSKIDQLCDFVINVDVVQLVHKKDLVFHYENLRKANPLGRVIDTVVYKWMSNNDARRLVGEVIPKDGMDYIKFPRKLEENRQETAILICNIFSTGPTAPFKVDAYHHSGLVYYDDNNYYVGDQFAILYKAIAFCQYH